MMSVQESWCHPIQSHYVNQKSRKRKRTEPENFDSHDEIDELVHLENIHSKKWPPNDDAQAYLTFTIFFYKSEEWR